MTATIHPAAQTRGSRMNITDIQFAKARLARAKATARIITDWDEAQQCTVGALGIDPWGDMVQKCGREDWRAQGAGIGQAEDGPFLPLVVVYEPEGEVA